MNIESSLPPPSPTRFFEGVGEKIFKNMVIGSNFLKDLHGKPRGRRQRKRKSHRKMQIFSFSFSNS